MATVVAVDEASGAKVDLAARSGQVVGVAHYDVGADDVDEGARSFVGAYCGVVDDYCA